MIRGVPAGRGRAALGVSGMLALVLQFFVAAGILGSTVANAQTRQGRVTIEVGGTDLCLGTLGPPGVGVAVRTVACDTAPAWSVRSPSNSDFFIVYGPGGDWTNPTTSDLCMAAGAPDAANGNGVSLSLCDMRLQTRINWTWPTPAGQTQPNGAIVNTRGHTCLTPGSAGDQVTVAECGATPADWAMTDPVPTSTLEGRIRMDDFNGAPQCLGILGYPPSFSSVLTSVACDGAPAWSIAMWTRDAPVFRIAIGSVSAASDLCLNVSAYIRDPAKIYLFDCGMTGLPLDKAWYWPTPVTDQMPNGEIKFVAQNSCIAPATLGEPLSLAACDPAAQTWKMVAPTPPITIAGRIGAQDLDGSPRCLGIVDDPQPGAAVISVPCDSAFTWSIQNWTPDGVAGKVISYGTTLDATGLCLSIPMLSQADDMNVSLQSCGLVGFLQEWSWPTPSDSGRPNSVLTAFRSASHCVAPAALGKQVTVVDTCDPTTDAWAMLDPLPRPVIDGQIRLVSLDGQPVGLDAPCLGIIGAAEPGSSVTSAACDGAPAWSIVSGSEASSVRVLEYGGAEAASGLCLSMPRFLAPEGDPVTLQQCGAIEYYAQRWFWASPVGDEAPDGFITDAGKTGHCLYPPVAGEPATLNNCVSLAIWKMLNAAESETFVTDGEFTAPRAGAFRVLAVGGGGGGGFDDAGGGGSGRVSYMSVNLEAGETVKVTLGAGGLGGTVNGMIGGTGGDTSFGTYLSAPGGDGGRSQVGGDGGGGDGGSGGGGDPAAGGRDGGDGGNSNNTTGGSGQGAAEFSVGFCKFSAVRLGAGAGGTSSGINGSGGGGGGGVLVDGRSADAAMNAAGTAQGGTGYGGGGAGGNGRLRNGPLRDGGVGASGVLIVETGGSVTGTCN